LWGFSELLWAPVLFLLAVADLIEISETFIVALSLSLSLHNTKRSSFRATNCDKEIRQLWAMGLIGQN